MKNLLDLANLNGILIQLRQPNIIIKKQNITEVLNGLTSPVEECICVLFLVMILISTIPIINHFKKSKI